MLYKIFKNIPKQYKYSLGEDMLNLSWKCLDTVLECNLADNKEKYNIIISLSLHFDKLKLRLRLMQEINIISKRQFVHIYDNYLKDIGNMIGGWQKWAKQYK